MFKWCGMSFCSECNFASFKNICVLLPNWIVVFFVNVLCTIAILVMSFSSVKNVHSFEEVILIRRKFFRIQGIIGRDGFDLEF